MLRQAQHEEFGAAKENGPDCSGPFFKDAPFSDQ
jgi:hypothetical protein